MNGPTQISNKLLAWGADCIEDNTLEQASKSARLPFIASHVALMPDAHVGFGSTVGSVIPTMGAVIPAAIGVDIGCGMIAVETNLTAERLPDDLSLLHLSISRGIPSGVGKGHHGTVAPGAAEWMAQRHETVERIGLTSTQSNKALGQLGSLGSGNHFVEVCLDERGVVWVVLHSGSRGIGNELAKIHIDGAKAMMKRYFIELEDPDLAYLVEGTPEFDAYITAMLWAQDYALANREIMMNEILKDIRHFIGAPGENIERSRINCHHNFTQREHHHGRDPWVTRKGAIKASKGDLGVIPGSMGTGSFIVSGLGSKASFDSCSHGAGRRFSRGEARKRFTSADLIERMGDRAWNLGDAQTLVDEIPDAYKDINQVMGAQSDLVEVLHTLRQILNYKGC